MFHSHLCSSVFQYFLSFHKFNCSKILWPDALPDASRYDDGAQYLYWDTICQSRLKSHSPAHEMETASCQAPNWYFKVSGIIKTQILFNPLVIKIQILSLDRLNSLNASHCPHIETSQLICSANQLTGFYMRETLTFNELNEQNEVHRFTNPPLVTSLPTISAAFISQDLCVMWGLLLKT